MRAWPASLFTICLLAACYVVSALVYFDLTWILIWVTSLWAGIDSAKLELNRYKLGFSCRPAALFCLCALLWIFIFPWYLLMIRAIGDGSSLLNPSRAELTPASDCNFAASAARKRTGPTLARLILLAD